MENKYDVIIVGAGPGGLRTAEILGQAGKKVLILEKNPEIGPKICAGGLTRKSIALLGVPEELFERSFESVIFQSPSIRSRLEFGELLGATINRTKLGQWQVKKLENSSVEIRTNAKVTEITNKHVTINGDEKIKYDFLVGADGSNSIVRKFLRKPAKLVGIAFQHIIPVNSEDAEMHFDSHLFGPWYAWIFPYQGKTSVGYCCYPKLISMERARKNFKKWLEKNKIDISMAEIQAHPINCDYRGYKFGNIFLVGDAAGFVSGFTGEGIYQALASGEDIANLIISPSHKPDKIKEIRREIMLHNFMLAIVFLSGPFRNPLYNLVARCVHNRSIGRLLARAMT